MQTSWMRLLKKFEKSIRKLAFCGQSNDKYFLYDTRRANTKNRNYNLTNNIILWRKWQKIKFKKNLKTYAGRPMLYVGSWKGYSI